MYSAVAYCVIGTPATGDATVQQHKVHVTADNAVSYPRGIEKTITVVLDTPEIEEPKLKLARKPFFKSPIHEIAAPWRARWRLRQQRPRDGLHS